jgi:hypothetical protein
VRWAATRRTPPVRRRITAPNLRPLRPVLVPGPRFEEAKLLVEYLIHIAEEFDHDPVGIVVINGDVVTDDVADRPPGSLILLRRSHARLMSDQSRTSKAMREIKVLVLRRKFTVWWSRLQRRKAKKSLRQSDARNRSFHSQTIRRLRSRHGRGKDQGGVACLRDFRSDHEPPRRQHGRHGWHGN